MINLFMLCCACGFTACAGLGALQEDNYQEFKQEEKVEFKQDNKKYISYNEDSYFFTFTAYELNNYKWANLFNALNDEDEITISDFRSDNTYIDYDSNQIEFSELAQLDNLTYENEDYNIKLYLDDINTCLWRFDNEIGEFELGMTWYVPSQYYEFFKSAIELDIQANTTGEEDYQNALGQFVQILVSGIQSLATGVASGIVGMASALFLETDNGSVTGLSVFGGIVAIFAGLALAIGITTKVYTWVTSLGN